VVRVEKDDQRWQRTVLRQAMENLRDDITNGARFLVPLDNDGTSLGYRLVTGAECDSKLIRLYPYYFRFRDFVKVKEADDAKALPTSLTKVNKSPTVSPRGVRRGRGATAFPPYASKRPAVLCSDPSSSLSVTPSAVPKVQASLTKIFTLKSARIMTKACSFELLQPPARTKVQTCNYDLLDENSRVRILSYLMAEDLAETWMVSAQFRRGYLSQVPFRD
jgi:hypothetical protein